MFPKWTSSNQCSLVDWDFQGAKQNNKNRGTGRTLKCKQKTNQLFFPWVLSLYNALLPVTSSMWPNAIFEAIHYSLSPPRPCHLHLSASLHHPSPHARPFSLPRCWPLHVRNEHVPQGDRTKWYHSQYLCPFLLHAKQKSENFSGSTLRQLSPLWDMCSVIWGWRFFKSRPKPSAKMNTKCQTGQNSLTSTWRMMTWSDLVIAPPTLRHPESISECKVEWQD